MDLLISEDLEAPAIEELATSYSVIREPLLWKTPSRLKENLRDARTLMVRNQTQVTADVLSAASNLLAVGRVGVGLDNIDLQAATQRGIVVIAPLNANATSVAELTIGLIVALSRKLTLADRSTKAGAWDRKGCTGLELDGSTLAICGLGRIGRLVALRARAFGMKLVVFDPFLKAESPALAEIGAQLCDKLQDAVAQADFVTVHSPLTSETRHLFNDHTFAAMKKGAFFINTSRGGVMDEQSLLNALRTGHLAGAALDVRETEPPVARNDFASMDNVILTPHIGAFTVQAQTRTFEAVCGDLARLLRGEAALNFVNLSRPLPKPKS
jgi:D-3-phosphoglycerate dehydrogenase